MTTLVSDWLRDFNQGSHTPFWDWGPGPWNWEKQRCFLKIWKKTWHILLSIYLFPSIVHHVSYCTYNQSAFRNQVFCPWYFSTFPIFVNESHWENLGSKLGKKDTILHWEWGLISAPNQADREPCQLLLFSRLLNGICRNLTFMKQVFNVIYQVSGVFFFVGGGMTGIRRKQICMNC